MAMSEARRTDAQTIYVCSDSLGDTAEAVVQAAIHQFDMRRVQIVRCAQLRTEDEIRDVVETAERSGGFIAYTLVQPELREMMKVESIRRGVRVVDIMGPMMQAFIDTFHDHPKRQPGLLHTLNDEYFRRVDAIEFAVKADDGRDPRALLNADIVLLGVSRTSKTPVSVFLAHKGLRVANLPLVPEVRLPDELRQISRDRIVGFTMRVDNMIRIRSERLRHMGLPMHAQYADRRRIEEELLYAETVVRDLGCPLIDVTDRAIEETAQRVLELVTVARLEQRI
ncbi:hypothetical protein C7445_102211 [Alicyclobacillus sacchari]|uniref:Putative pyruvate, phosphate dikinase regulatory protein n=2 Tax=Alicyclobacillus sacchari TaxID=392010 RepID=A0A4V3HEX4_9BACL|nr:hypothetical protein C7445_102211 [Alicyclobacillus sacchari]